MNQAPTEEIDPFCGRVHYTLVVLASLFFLWFLAYWNLLGFHF